MARTILTELAFFATPFVIYAIVLFLMKKDARDREHWEAKVIGWLALAGIVLVAASLAWFAHYGGYKPGGTYVPAYIDKDGKLVPGYTK
jgi:asparagine N-glycosylation enzyme membrane subunit Stt3